MSPIVSKPTILFLHWVRAVRSVGARFIAPLVPVEKPIRQQVRGAINLAAPYSDLQRSYRFYAYASGGRKGSLRCEQRASLLLLSPFRVFYYQFISSTSIIAPRNPFPNHTATSQRVRGRDKSLPYDIYARKTFASTITLLVRTYQPFAVLP